MLGDWNGDGKTKVGVFVGNGLWHLDVDGRCGWTGADRVFVVGQAGDKPVVGKW